ncbi:MAG TPA: universal stress protein [Jatrophihabitans sp.]|nr:universal stress protein [Jatrophihabitans sp.]
MSVVVGYVPDNTGFLAIKEAAREARWRETDVMVVNVVDTTSGYAVPTAADEKQMDAVESYLRDAGVPYSNRQITHQAGSAAEEILQLAAESSAELIVVGIRRRSAVAKAVLGSNAQRILTAAPCPVLAVRAPDE